MHCLHHHLLVQTGAVCVFLQDQGKFDLQMTAGVHARTFAAFRKEGILHPSDSSISLECGMKVCPHMMLNCWKKIGQLWREFLRLTILNEEIGLPSFSRILTRNVLITIEVGIHSQSTRLLIFINVLHLSFTLAVFSHRILAIDAAADGGQQDVANENEHEDDDESVSTEVLLEGSVTDDKRGKAGGQSQREKGSLNNFSSCNLSKLDFRNCKP